ncbi:hypothetical protein [Rhodospirillum centenum]|uniref:DUF945 domain-containing protein n=1 Tax=Rhodospirillum centenum (strain ATCC 51521 / SW) TaxID=414684 RepID=B6IUI1_RHOCS|nr:hypothetical protein [Rhodospirillum centenum]ACI99806.1 hypothetical protein RC1_2421 [Rhodospirillum centenum SW]
MRSKTAAALLVLLAALAASVGPAVRGLAQEAVTAGMPAGVTPTGAELLRELLEARLAELTAPRFGRPRLDRAPEVEVAPDDGYYEVRVPSLRVVLTNGWLVEALDLHARATPTAGGGWEVTGTLPVPLAVYSAEGFRAGELTLGRQSFKGRWSPDLRTLEALDASVRDLLFTPRDGTGTLQAAAVTVKMAPESYADGRWTGPATVTLSELSMNGADGQAALALTKLTAKLRVEDLDVARYAAWNAALARRAAVDDGQEGLTAAEREALQQALPNLDGLLSRAQAEVEVRGLRRRFADGTRSALDSATWTLAADGLQGERVRLSLDYAHKGLVADGPSVKRPVVPGRGEIRLTAEDLPRRALLDAWTRRLAEEPAIGGGAARENFDRRILTALGDAGAEVRLDRLGFEAQEAGATANGIVSFDDATAHGLLGGLSMTLRGFDALIAQATDGYRMRNTGAALGLFALQGLGSPDTDREGRATRAYRLEVAPDGRILLNGTEVTSLITGLMALR